MANSDRFFKLRAPPQTPEDEICKCEATKPIKLMQALGYNPLHCIDCNLQIAPESLSLSESLIEHIAEWSRLYDAIDRLWLDSGAYEDWAEVQLLDITSPVNQRGLAVRQELEAIRPCYYWCFQDESSESFEPLTLCPACQRPLTKYPHGIFPQLICQSCTLIMSE